ncbi:MAG: hypothetical protein ACRYHQ_03330 [Janthinobacterium lividum]
MSERGCIYKFRLGRDASGAYVGEMVDDWGWTIAIRAEVVERGGVKAFEGTGTLTNATAGKPSGSRSGG